jgi:hypothetical protein
MKNPLSDYYREKEIYVKLPTQGKWYNKKPNLNKDGEIGVRPMTLKDEMLLKIPDSLYNGESLYEVFKSIVPDIPDPYDISIPDVDVILLASKAVSNGNELHVDAKCPTCMNTASYSINIPNMLSKIKTNTDGVEIEIKNLKIKLKPNTLAAVTASSIQTVENAKLISSMSNETNPQNKELMQKSLEKSTAATIGLLADNIEQIELPNGTIVTDKQQIVEWMVNSDAATINVLKKYTVELNKNGLPKEFPFICDNEECNQQFNSSIEFNPTFFFMVK